MINLYTTEQVYEITEAFFKMLNELQTEVSVNQTNVNEADKAFGDIRHFCEFNYPTERKKRTSVCKLIRDYSKQRRESKDFLSIAGIWHKFSAMSKGEFYGLLRGRP